MYYIWIYSVNSVNTIWSLSMFYFEVNFEVKPCSIILAVPASFENTVLVPRWARKVVVLCNEEVSVDVPFLFIIFTMLQ